MAAVTSLRPITFGDRLRSWRMRRRLSQLQLANLAEVSARHLSFLETGRSRPSRELVLHLAEHLDVPLRERNTLLVAAGFAPTFRETPLEDPPMTPVRDALQALLRSHEPFPAIVVDRAWNLVAANRPTVVLTEGVAPHLIEPPINVMRISLHPEGIAPRVINFDEYRSHLLTRLARDAHITGDETLAALYEEVRGYVGDTGEHTGTDAVNVVLPLRLRSDHGELSLFSTVAVFGTPVDITLDELAIEQFFPADEHTAEVLRAQFTRQTAPSA
jgi:transcriptional regulator with XRE-family HTH domain